MSMEQRKTVLKREERRKELRRVEESTKKAAGLALIYERQSSEETGWDPLQSFRVGSDETLQVFLGRSSDDCFRTRPINQTKRDDEEREPGKKVSIRSPTPSNPWPSART